MKKLFVLVSVVALFAAVACKSNTPSAEQLKADSIKKADSIAAVMAADTTKKVDSTVKDTAAKKVEAAKPEAKKKK
jgi:uncharacterized protein YcfL